MQRGMWIEVPIDVTLNNKMGARYATNKRWEYVAHDRADSLLMLWPPYAPDYRDNHEHGDRYRLYEGYYTKGVLMTFPEDMPLDAIKMIALQYI